MEYEEIKLVKQSEKSAVYLVGSGGQRYVRKVLAGRHPVYQVLQDNPHAGLPRLYEVDISEASTTVIEEYIEGQSAGAAQLSGRQYRQMVRELCSVLEFLHGKGIVHRDIKPSNIILASDGHVRLIDFDIARIAKEEQEQDTRILGTRGFAPPEQYGFAQTDGRTDIYALGVTLEQLLTEENGKPHYKRVLRKCVNPDPNKRYQSAEQLRRAFFPGRRNALWGCGAVCLAVLIGVCAEELSTFREGRLAETGNSAAETGNSAAETGNSAAETGNSAAETGNSAAETGNSAAELTVLPAPGNPHWDGETGIMVWGNVPESGVGDEVRFRVRLYRRDTADAPGPGDEDWYFAGELRAGGSFKEEEVVNFGDAITRLAGNGFYYFAVAAAGDGVRYADSAYVISDVFEYTGETAPPLPAPEGLAWKMVEKDNARHYYASWSNLDDYDEKDIFNVTFYDEAGNYVMNNTWPLSKIKDGEGGIPIRTEFLEYKTGSEYRFTVQVYSSRPNEYSSSPMPDPPTEEYLSPPLLYGPQD